MTVTRSSNLVPQKPSHVFSRFVGAIFVGVCKRVDTRCDAFRCRTVLPLPHQSLLLSYRSRTCFANLTNPILYSSIQSWLIRDDAVDKSPVLCRGSIDILSEIKQPSCTTHTDQPRQQSRLNHRRNADLHFRHSKGRTISSNPEVARSHNLKTSAKTVPINTSNDRDRQISKCLASEVDARDELPSLIVARDVVHLVDVCATDECRCFAWTGLAAFEDDCSERLVVAEFFALLGQL